MKEWPAPFRVSDKVTLNKRGEREYACDAVRPGVVYSVESVESCRTVQLIALSGIVPDCAKRLWLLHAYFRLVHRTQAKTSTVDEKRREER